MRVLLLLAGLSLIVVSSPARAPDGAWHAQLLATDLAAPVDIVFGPDGTLYYAELDAGNVRAIPPGASSPLAEPVAHVESYRDENGGLLGVALDPDFADTGAFFVYYSMEKAGAKNGAVNRVSRLDASGETVILDDIPHFERHNGGRLVFIAEDELVVNVGDNELRAPAQDPASILGKTLRMTREGKPVAGNVNGTLVYTLGHRNAFGLAWDAENKVLWNTENGPASDDEVNILVAGGNYGWPERQGITGSRQYIDAVAEFDKTIGPTGGTVLDGDLYFGAVNDGKVRRVHCEGDARPCVVSEVWDTVVVLDVEAREGRLYVATFDEIWVLSPPGMAAPDIPSPSPAPSPSPRPSPGPPSTSPTESSEPPSDEARIPAAGALLAVAAAAMALVRRRQA